jgi:hypothetical protein
MSQTVLHTDGIRTSDLILVFKIGGHLLDVVLETYHLISVDDLPDWVNAFGLLLANLPEVYSEGLDTFCPAAF